MSAHKIAPGVWQDDGPRVLLKPSTGGYRLPESIVKQMGEGAQGFEDYQQMLDTVQLDAVIVATPLHMHAPITIAARVTTPPHTTGVIHRGYREPM